ncbi:MAG TPA: SAM-dependent chlorinase/fluorinase [Bacillota bacterium]|nr:SAM-dependent chlorinase/fluorinase [Bacillota bacterium]
MQLITLTTDFGTRDWFVGTMKGVILGLNGRARLVDITHELPAGDLRAGAFALAASYRYFPKGTIHVVVVDPGVGSQRKAIAVQTAAYSFVGPDNGVLSWALRTEAIQAIHSLENPKYFRHPVSRTFHGRDIFAPVAAHLSRGVSLLELGPAQADLVRLNWPQPVIAGQSVQGEVVYIDRFGNAITNIEEATLGDLKAQAWQVFLGRKRLCALAACYQAVPSGHPVAVAGSSRFLEIAINSGTAAQDLGLRIGQKVTVRVVSA